MRRSRAPFFTAAGLALLLASPASAGTSLDGVRRTQHSYSGQMSRGVTISTSPSADPTRPVNPAPEDCVDDSCHRTAVTLQLPRDRQSGELSFQVHAHPVGAETPQGYADAVAYGVYDSKNRQVGYWSPCCAAPSPDRSPGTRPATASKPIVIARLPAGTYTLYVFNLGGPTAFTATVSWRANKSHRPTP